VFTPRPPQSLNERSKTSGLLPTHTYQGGICPQSSNERSKTSGGKGCPATRKGRRPAVIERTFKDFGVFGSVTISTDPPPRSHRTNVQRLRVNHHHRGFGHCDSPRSHRTNVQRLRDADNAEGSCGVNPAVIERTFEDFGDGELSSDDS